MTLRQTHDPLPLTAEEVEPERRAFHALLNRGMALLVWLLLGLVLAGVAFYPQRHGPALRALADSLGKLLRPGDWAWVIGLGVGGPLLWNLAIAQLSPLAAHEWNPGTSGFNVPIGQVSATLVLLLAAPLRVVRWRLKKRAPFLGFGSGSGWIGLLAVVAAAIALPLFGLGPYVPGLFMFLLQFSWVLLAGALGWLVFTMLTAWFGKSDAALRRQIVGRTLRVPYSVAMLLVIATMPAFHAVERHWVRLDTLNRSTPEEPSLSALEYRVNEQLKQELLEAFEAYPD